MSFYSTSCQEVPSKLTGSVSRTRVGLVRHRGEPGPAAVVPVASGYGGREGDVPSWLLAMPGILCPHMAIDSCFQNPTLHPTCICMTLHAIGLYMYLPESHEHGQPLLAAFFLVTLGPMGMRERFPRLATGCPSQSLKNCWEPRIQKEAPHHLCRFSARFVAHCDPIATLPSQAWPPPFPA